MNPSKAFLTASKPMLKTCDICESVMIPHTVGTALLFECSNPNCNNEYKYDPTRDKLPDNPMEVLIRNAKAVARDKLLPVNESIKCECGQGQPLRQIRDTGSLKYISICPACGRNYS